MRALVVSIVLLLGGTAWAEAELHLVAAGNNLGHAGDATLKYAENDASRLARVMRRLGGVPAQNTVLLLGEDAASFRQVLLQTNAKLRQADQQPADSMLVVYYSGHADTNGLHLGKSTLPFEELRAMVAGCPARVRILIVDSCRSGGATRVKGVTEAEAFEITISDRIQAEGLAIITSSAAGEHSHESDQLRSSFFSHHLVNALRGAADRNQDGRVTLNEAYGYAYHQTLRSSGRTLNLQHPTYQYDIKGKGDLVLTKLANDRDRSGLLHVKQAGQYLVMEGDEEGPVAAEVSVPDEGTRLVLPAGSYFVQRRAPDHFLEYQVSLQPGVEVDLSDLEPRTVEYARLVRKGGGDKRTAYGLYLLGGARGETLPGAGVTPHMLISSSLDFPWLSLGLRVRYTRGSYTATDGILKTTHSELGAGLTLQRYLDLPWFSVSLGLLGEVAHHWQDFDNLGEVDDRTSWSFSFGGLTTAEVEVVSALVLVLEFGALTQVYKQGETRAGAEAGSKTASPFTWWAAAGLGWRF